MGVGYTGVLLTMGIFRELVGSGKIVAFNQTLISLGPHFEPPRILVLFPGAFMTFWFLMAILNKVQARRRS